MHRWVLVLSGALFLCGWADSGRAEESAAGKPLSPAEASVFAYVPGDAVVLLSARPATVFKHELIAGFPGVKEGLNELAEELRMDPQTMARATAALWHGEGYFFPGRPSKPRLEEPAADADALPEKPGAPDSFEPPNIDAVFIVQLTKPFDAQDFEAKHPFRKFTDESYKGIKYRTANGLAYYMPNRTTLIVTQPVNMKSVLEAKAQAKPAKIVERAMKHGLNHDAAMFLEFASFRPLLKAWLRIAGDRTAGILELPDRLEQLTARVDFQERVDFQLVVETNQEAAAKTVHAIYGEGHEFFMQQLPELSRELKREMGEELGGELAKFLKEAYSAAKAEAAGKRVTVSLRTPPVPKPLVKKSPPGNKRATRRGPRKSNCNRSASHATTITKPRRNFRSRPATSSVGGCTCCPRSTSRNSIKSSISTNPGTASTTKSYWSKCRMSSNTAPMPRPAIRSTSLPKGTGSSWMARKSAVSGTSSMAAQIH